MEKYVEQNGRRRRLREFEEQEGKAGERMEECGEHGGLWDEEEEEEEERLLAVADEKGDPPRLRSVPSFILRARASAVFMAVI